MYFIPMAALDFWRDHQRGAIGPAGSNATYKPFANPPKDGCQPSERGENKRNEP